MVQCDWCDKLFKKPAELAKHKKEYKQVDARKILLYFTRHYFDGKRFVVHFALYAVYPAA